MDCFTLTSPSRFLRKLTQFQNRGGCLKTPVCALLGQGSGNASEKHESQLYFPESDTAQKWGQLIDHELA